ncbi:hypothetical protein BKA62DRAFT_720328 [Auriculariales sp. MPI-PUGE-AT-0066]|nr:hypothetical protein BKA62DRAFT_720328 [Auriculariales sp. MPI-PUGE-AT-0066]
MFLADEQYGAPRVATLPRDVLALIFEEAAHAWIQHRPKAVCDLMLVSSAVRLWLLPIAYFTFAVAPDSPKSLRQARSMLTNPDDVRRRYLRYLLVDDDCAPFVPRVELPLSLTPDTCTILAPHRFVEHEFNFSQRPPMIEATILIPAGETRRDMGFMTFIKDQPPGSRVKVRQRSNPDDGWSIILDDRRRGAPDATTQVYLRSFSDPGAAATAILNEIANSSVIISSDSAGDLVSDAQALQRSLLNVPHDHRSRVGRVDANLLIHPTQNVHWVARRLRESGDIWPRAILPVW